jgi:hypothetical protein
VPGDEPLQILLRGLLDRDVVGQLVVVLGDPRVDVDGQAQPVGDGLRGLDCAALRAADDAGDREPRQRVR